MATPGSTPETEGETPEAGTARYHQQLDPAQLQAIMPSLNIDMARFVEEIDRGNRDICRQLGKGFKHRMRSELRRLKTFEDFDPFVSWSPEEMASQGLYYTGLKWCVQCFCCGGVFCSTSVSRSPGSEHRRFEPECGFVKRLDVGDIPKYALRVRPPEDIPLGQREWLREAGARLETFEGWPFYVNVEPGLLVAAGFFYTGVKDQVQCFSCNGSLMNWEEDDDPWKEHSKWFPECAYLQSVKSPAEINQYGCSYVGFHGVTAAHFLTTSSSEDVCSKGSDSWPDPEGNWNIFADEKTRLESFHTWPPDVSASPAELAEAGFFYQGLADHIQCFCCGIQLSKWEEGDNAWTEHKRHSSECPFLLRREQAGARDVEGEQLKELPFTTPNEEPGETEDSVGGETPSNEDSWARTAGMMRRRLRKLYSSSAFSTVSFNDCLSFDLRRVYAELHLVLKSVRDRPLQRVTLAEFLRDLDRVTVLEGEAGSGKSALLRKVATLWGSGRCPLLARFQLVLLLSLRSLGPGQSVAAAVRGQLLGEDAELSDGALRELVRRARSRVLLLLDDYGEADSGAPQFIEEELIRRNHLSGATVVVGLRTNRTASVRQYANAVVSIAEFPLYGSIHILKTLFSHDPPRLRRLIHNLGWSKTLQGTLKTPAFALAVCQLWVQRPLEASLHGLALFQAFLRYSLRTGRRGERAQASWAACGRLALTGVFGSRFEFAGEDLALAGVEEEEALRLGLLTKFTAQRLKPVYRFFHASFQEFLAGSWLGELLGSEGAALRQEGLSYLRRINTFLLVFTRYYYLLLYTAGSSTGAASHVVSHLLAMTRVPSSFDSQADPSPCVQQHPDLELVQEFLIQIPYLMEPEDVADLVTKRVLAFAVRSAADRRGLAAIAPVILKFLGGRPLQLTTSDVTQDSVVEFLKLHPETLPVLSHLQISVFGKQTVNMPSYPKMAECMSNFGVPKVEEDYLTAFQPLKQLMERNEAKSEEIRNFSSMIVRSIPDSFMKAFVSVPDCYKTPKLKLCIHNVDTLQEDDSKHLLTLCSLSNCIELTLSHSQGVLAQMGPAIALYRDRFKALDLNRNKFSLEDQALITSMTMVESLELTFTDDQLPEYLLGKLDMLEHLRDLKIDAGAGSSQRIIAQIPERFAKLQGIEKLILSGVNLIQDSLKLVSFLRSFPQIRIFHLKCSKVPEFEELISTLASCSGLEELVLSDIHLSPTETNAFAAALRELQNLKVLDIPSISFSHPEESEAFAHVLGSLVKLEELHLCNSDGTITAAAPLTQQLQNLQCLRVLAITKTLDDQSLVKLAMVARSGHLSRLHKLNLSLNEDLSDLGWREFFQTLSNTNELRELNISRIYTNQLKPQPDTFKAFVQCVSRLPALVTVYMLSWMLDVMDFNMFNVMKENHPQSRCLRLLWQWTLPFTPIVQAEG
ncbi:baculoviral IAP repeat-containing protein 1-like [Carcharodon carcharias]|uniref:baculoviral IAP repeat-containing protein 1-like n=1 Tax=Carcharodon carcharias TaxID=13397 RepID=UPI001B7E4EA2|nr:baculoviral IAP repeat-containing protein 1-like [Carcharodon carcharias]